MFIPRSIACAAVAVATAAALALPAQAGLAATGTAASVEAGVQHRASTTAETSVPVERSRTASPLLAARAGDPDAESTDDSDDESADDSSDAVEVVDGTDAPEDDADVLADDSSSSGSTARRDRTSGRWARIARPSAVRATVTAASRARVTWRSSVGGVLAQRFVVELRAGRSVLRATTFSSARSATVWGLSPAKRYSVSVTAVAADGTRRSATGAAVRTPAVAKTTKTTKTTRTASTSKGAASVAKAAARHAKAASLG